MNRADTLREIEEVVRNPLKSIARWKERSGGKVMGCLCCMPPFVPEELIHAAGMLPVGLWGAEIPVRLADAKLQSFACSIARTSLEMGLNEALSVCDGFLFPSTCDAFQNLSEVWGTSTGTPCFEVTFPKRPCGEPARRYLEKEFELFQAEMEGFSGEPTSERRLRESIQVYNENRRLMRALDRMRARTPRFLSSRQMNEIVLACSFLPREEHSPLVRSLLDAPPEAELEQGDSGADPKGPVRIFLTGVMARPSVIANTLDELEVWVVGDDLGLGSLYYATEIPEGGEAHADLAAGYLRYPPCSTLHPSSPARAGTLIDRVRDRRAEGVLILITKFCEPELFDHPLLKEDLDEAGIPSALVETELGMTAPGGLRTRIEAFIETLKERRKSRAARRE